MNKPSKATQKAQQKKRQYDAAMAQKPKPVEKS